LSIAAKAAAQVQW